MDVQSGVPSNFTTGNIIQAALLRTCLLYTSIALRAIVEPGDEVLIPEPSFVSYKPCTVMAGGKPVVVGLRGENEFKLTVEDLEPLVTEKTKVLIFPYPGNPTGATMHREDMIRLCECCLLYTSFSSGRPESGFHFW